MPTSTSKVVVISAWGVILILHVVTYKVKSHNTIATYSQWFHIVCHNYLHVVSPWLYCMCIIVSTTTLNENSAHVGLCYGTQFSIRPMHVALHPFPHCGTVASSKLQWKIFCRVSKPRKSHSLMLNQHHIYRAQHHRGIQLMQSIAAFSHLRCSVKTRKPGW